MGIGSTMTGYRNLVWTVIESYFYLDQDVDLWTLGDLITGLRKAINNFKSKIQKYSSSRTSLCSGELLVDKKEKKCFRN